MTSCLVDEIFALESGSITDFDPQGVVMSSCAARKRAVSSASSTATVVTSNKRSKLASKAHNGVTAVASKPSVTDPKPSVHAMPKDKIATAAAATPNPERVKHEQTIARLRREENELLKNAFQTLPNEVQTRRRAHDDMQFVEYIDFDRANEALLELQRACKNQKLADAQREEAAYLKSYLYSFLDTLNRMTSPSMCLPKDSCDPKQSAALPRVMMTQEVYESSSFGRRYKRLKATNSKGCRYKPQHAQRSGSKHQEPRYFGLQMCPKVLRPALCGAFNHDIDIRIAHPTIASQMLKKLAELETDPALAKQIRSIKLSAFEDYIENRDVPGGWVETLCKHHEIIGSRANQKEVIKHLLCRIMFGGSYEYWLQCAYGIDPLKKPMNGPHPKVVGLVNEMCTMRRIVAKSSTWKEFYKRQEKVLHVKNRIQNEYACVRGESRKDINDSKVARSIFSVILQTIENDIIEVMYDVAVATGWTVTTLMFDGCHILHREGNRIQDFMAQCEQKILERTGYKVVLVEKPLFGLQRKRIELTRI